MYKKKHLSTIIFFYLLLFIFLLSIDCSNKSKEKKLPKLKEDMPIYLDEKQVEDTNTGMNFVPHFKESQLISVKNNYIFIVSNVEGNKNITKYEVDKKGISQKEKVLVIEDTNNKKISKSQFNENIIIKKYSLGNILKITTNDDEEIYAETLKLLDKRTSPSDIHAKPNVDHTYIPEGYRKSATDIKQPTSSTDPRIANTKPSYEEPQFKIKENSKIKKSIYKYDQEGNFLYEIGYKGKNSVFPLKYNIIDIFCDKNNYLYVVIKMMDKLSAKGLGANSFKIIRYDEKGNVIDNFLTDNMKFKFDENNKDNKPLYVIEDIKISPRSEKLFVFISYYGKKYIQTLKRLFLYNIRSKEINVITTFYNPNSDSDNDSEKNKARLDKDLTNFSMLGISEEDNVYLIRQKSVGIMQVRVLDSNGNVVSDKEIDYVKSDKEWRSFLLKDNGRIVGIFVKDGKYAFSYY